MEKRSPTSHKGLVRIQAKLLDEERKKVNFDLWLRTKKDVCLFCGLEGNEKNVCSFSSAIELNGKGNICFSKRITFAENKFCLLLKIFYI